MEPFKSVTSVVAALDRPNIDTDQIIPAVHLKSIKKSGFGPFLFERWRTRPDGTPDPDFELNQPAFKDAQILVSGPNFGSGSSREHAVWALMQAGFRVVIAPSFADIFHKNSFENGFVPVILPERTVNDIISRANELTGYELTADLEASEIYDNQGFKAPLVMHPDPATNEFRRYCILNGLDEIGLTLRREDDIAAYERAHF